MEGESDRKEHSNLALSCLDKNLLKLPRRRLLAKCSRD